MQNLDFLNRKVGVDVFSVMKEVILDELDPREHLKLGLEALDCLTYKKRGFKNGQLLTIAGKPGTGKTALLLNLCVKAIKNGHKACYITAEMSEMSLGSRFIQLFRDDLERALLFRETNNLNLDLLFAMDIAKVKSAICATDAEIVFIDFAQNIYSERGTTQREKSRIIIQEIIETINIHKKFCVLASQFNMEGQKGKMDLSNLGGGVVIGQLSDYVYGLEWNGNINADGSREIVGMCLKNRHGNWLHSMLNFYPKNMARKTIPGSTTNNKEELLPYCENHDNIHNEEFTF